MTVTRGKLRMALAWLARRVMTVMLQPKRVSFSHTWRPTKPVPPNKSTRAGEPVISNLQWLGTWLHGPEK